MITTYEAMAGLLGIRYCRGILPTGHYCSREHLLNGSVSDDTIHFAERPVTRRDNVAFLKLAAQATDPSLADEPVPWRRIYRMDMLVRQIGYQLQVKVPADMFRMDKAFVLASVAGIPNSVPLRKKAFDWARR